MKSHIFDKNLIFVQNILVKNRNFSSKIEIFRQKSKFLSKIEISSKIEILSKIEISSKTLIVLQNRIWGKNRHFFKTEIYSKIEILVKIEIWSNNIVFFNLDVQKSKVLGSCIQFCTLLLGEYRQK